jgi:hypothetical protein
MTSTSPEALDLTETLLSIIRQQRHLGARVMIATQEPTLAPALLELCNLTIIHRFSSPAWFKAIKSHIAGAGNVQLDSDDGAPADIFHKIVRLTTGEALVFCSTALLDIQKLPCEHNERSMIVSHNIFDPKTGLNTPGSPKSSDGPGSPKSIQTTPADSSSSSDSTWSQVCQLGAAYALIRVRQRVTVDGGRSVLEH